MENHRQRKGQLQWDSKMQVHRLPMILRELQCLSLCKLCLLMESVMGEICGHLLVQRARYYYSVDAQMGSRLRLHVEVEEF